MHFWKTRIDSTICFVYSTIKGSKRTGRTSPYARFERRIEATELKSINFVKNLDKKLPAHRRDGAGRCVCLLLSFVTGLAQYGFVHLTPSTIA
jgi:hypothetical protein